MIWRLLIGLSVAGALFGLSVAGALFAANPTATAGGQPHPYVTLGEGSFDNYPWAVRVKRPEGRVGAGAHGAQRPLLEVGVEEPPSAEPFEEGMVFGGHSPFPERLTAKGEPLVVINWGWAPPGSIWQVRMTAVGLAFAPAARRIEMTRCNGSPESTRLHRLNLQQARKTRLERFRFLAFAVRGEWCYEKMKIFNARGAKLWDSDQLANQGPPRMCEILLRCGWHTHGDA